MNQAKPSMKRASSPLLPLILIGLGLLAIGAALFFAFKPGASASGAPKLSVDKQEVDFGDVKLGETVTATFTITNTGGAPLRFTEAPYIEIKEGC